MTTKNAISKKMPPLEALAQDYVPDNAEELDISKLDIFAMFASTAVAKKMDDPIRIAHESYQIAMRMQELSDYYKDK